MPFFVAERLSKTFRRGRCEVVALRDASIEISKGEFVCITGRSGSGKTTFLNLAGFLDFPTSGRILFDGEEASFSSTDGMAVFRRRRVGFVFQRMFLQDHLTAMENALLPLRYSGVGRREGEERAAALFEELGVSDRAGFFPPELSGGERQRVAIARALINSPSLLLADEPTSELDSANSAAIVSLLRTVSRKNSTAVVVVTHDPSVLPFADSVYSMNDGVLGIA